MKIETRKRSSAEKILDILMAFTPYNNEMGTMELGEKLEINASTVSRLIKILTSRGFLLRNPRTGKFRLGKSTADLGNTINYYMSDHLVTCAQPFIDELREKLGLVVGLEILSGNFTTLVYKAWGQHRFSSSFGVGDKLPAHIASGARAIMAFSSSEMVDTMLRGELEAWTENSITDRNVIKKKLVEFKRKGVSFDYGECNINQHYVAAPIFNHTKKPIAALVVGDLAEKIKGKFPPRLVSLVKQTAADISSQLFYSDDD